MKFYKYHGLGNDYIVIDPRETKITLDEPTIKLICDRNFGVGSDGILYGPEIKDNYFKLRIFNPDGSEAEKSGNGLRIFSRYLWDVGLVKTNPFTIRTIGGDVQSEIRNNGDLVKIEMGKVSFIASEIPLNGESGEVLNRNFAVKGRTFRYCAANIGNPHCVVLCDEISPELAKEYGPYIETNPMFPNRTNVQFLKIIDKNHIQIEIWERGAGYTLASGSSSTASAAVAFKLGLCGNIITVKMQGGDLSLEFTNDFRATMIGPVTPVYEGIIKEDFFKKSKR
ncbi:MAG: diaminopimelate epimerase [Bacteroidota bacterium]